MGVERPVLFVILLLAAGFVFFFLRKRMNVGFPTVRNLPEGLAVKTIKILLGSVLPGSAILSLILLASGFYFSSREVTRYGYSSDIMVVLDESDSMNDVFSGEKYVPPSSSPFGDYEAPKPEEPKRPRLGKLDIAKRTIRPFIQRRKDRLGLVVFGSTTAPIYPLSFNHEGFLRAFDAQIAPLMGTLIDRGLAQALEVLAESPAKSKVILLISDGQGGVDDEKYQLSALINAMGIRVYWVAVDHMVNWSSNLAHPMDDLIGKLNPAMFKTIPVTDSKGLEAAFQEIDRLERSLISYKDKVGEGRFSVVLAWISIISVAAFFCLKAIHND